ncbi:MAG: SAV_6107 family HEPN domain-containing protein [Coriobacteriia bacterium]
MTAGREEIEDLFRVVERDLADARIPALSADRRFATAYNAALQPATVVLRAEGYRTQGVARHHTTFEALAVVLGKEMSATADYLDACRSRRNTVDYDGIGIATEAEAEELVREAEALCAVVREWLAEAHPDLT